LLRIGVIEICRSPEFGKTGYCIGPKTRINITEDIQLLFDPASCSYRFKKVFRGDMINNSDEAAGNPFLLLKRLTSLEKVIRGWEQTEMEMKYKYDQFNPNHFSRVQDSKSCALYTTNDKMYLTKCVRLKNGGLYRIPLVENNIDAINIALSYVHIVNGKKMFRYAKNQKTLKCLNFHSMMPIIICRALVLCDPLYLLEDEAYLSIAAPEFRNITGNIICELKRIFGESAVEELND
jgi:hypothetical protein